MHTFIGVLLGGGILTFLQFLISRYDKRRDDLKEIRKSIDELRQCIVNVDEKADKRAAVDCRVRILHFEDELQEGRFHSKDSFDQVLSDITTYDQYCVKHPEFRNHQTQATVEHIRNVYDKRLEKRDFL